MSGKAFITGIQGFTGRYLASELHNSGYEVFGLAQSNEKNRSPCVSKIYVGDLSDAGNLTHILKEVKPDVVAHLAGISFIAHGNVEEIYRTNILGSRNLLEALSQQEKPLGSVLLASSAQVYGNASGVLDESAPLAPANDYAISKLAMEYLAKIYMARLPVTLVRPFNYTGVGQSENFVLPKIIKHFVKRASVIELGNLDVARDFSDVRTVAQYYRLLLENPKARSETYNICSGTAYKLEAILAMLESLSGHHLEVRINPAFVRENEVKMLVGSNAKLEATAGKTPEIPFINTLQWMLESTQ